MKKVGNIDELIGNTPLVRLRHVADASGAEVWAKLEGMNPGGSVKDRIAYSMIYDAEKRGQLEPGGTVVEPTSGNTGIGLAMVARVKGYKLILTMPDTMTLERRHLLEAYGATLVLTDGTKGMSGSVSKAEELVAGNPHFFMPQQFKNQANPEIHRRTTALEILHAFDSPVDGFVAGVGTGGTITGVGEVLKEKNPEVKVVAVEPAASAVLSGSPAGPHKIAGIGAGFVPDILNRSIYDEIAQVSDADAKRMSIRLSLEEGILAGISSGAAACAAIKLAKELGPGKRVVVIFPDRGDRYLSVGLFRE
ncbi:MAG: cysteine synthase A [Nitrospirae bacterium]|nr:cysteine synthase A [Nitrospirota bacterium]